MSSADARLGRDDQPVPLISWRTRTNLTLGLLGGGALLGWHGAVVLTADGLGAAELGRTSRALVHGHPLAGLTGVRTAGPAVTAAVWLVLLAGMFAVVVSLVCLGARRRSHRGGRGFADRAQVRRGIGVDRARSTAAQTRPGLSAAQRRKAQLAEVALPLGTSVDGEPVAVPLEDHVVVISPTGAGKTRDVMIAAAADAPGPLAVTCTRADLLDVVAARRARRGRVWVFDPLDRFGWPEPMTWNPVAGCRSGETAVARGLAFATGLGADDRSSTNAGFFRRNASSALTRLLHAADLDGRTIVDVLDWAVHLDNGADEPQDLIRRSSSPNAEPMWAGMLRSVATGADETVASSRQTLQQAVEALALRRVLRWVTPRPGVPAFDPAAFVASTDTLFLVADDNSSTNVAPLCAMLLQEVVDAAKRAAARLPGGRLDPPLRLVGDEIANVAPLPKLPDLGTDARGFGMQLVLALQSPAQATRRWGRDGGRTLLDNMPAELLLGGLTDTDALARYATLVGEMELHRSTTSYDPATGRATGSSDSLVDRKILRADEARQIPDGHGLLIYRNQRATLLRLTPWYRRPDGPLLETERRRTETRRLASRDPRPIHLPVAPVDRDQPEPAA